MKSGIWRLVSSEPRALAVQIGVGRTTLASLALAAPVPAARLLGADTATARRVTWLTRMMAVRDAALGLGTLRAARRGSDLDAWLLGGAVSDAVDAAVLAQALRRGTMHGPIPAGIAVAAAGLAALAVVTAVSVRH